MSRRASTRLGAAFIGTPSYPPEPADLATFRLLGLELPIRATAAIVVMVVVMLIDFHRDFLPDAVVFSRDAAAVRPARRGPAGGRGPPVPRPSETVRPARRGLAGRNDPGGLRDGDHAADRRLGR